MSDVVERAKAAVARIDGLQADGPICVDCHDREVGVGTAIVDELVAEVERLRAEANRAQDEGDWA